MIKGTAPMRLEMQWDGTEQELIEFCDELAKDGTEIGLDSLDVGDAMGYIISETMHNDMELTLIDRQGHILQASIVVDLFNWEGLEN